jgi:hypothetical protein
LLVLMALQPGVLRWLLSVVLLLLLLLPGHCCWALR